MIDSKVKTVKKRRFNYISAIFSIGMVLFMLGLFGVILLQTNTLSNYIKENLVINIFLNEDVVATDLSLIEGKLKTNTMVKNIAFVSKEQAAQQFSSEVGQDFVSFLGFNPLMPSFQITLKAEFASNENLLAFENEINQLTGVSEISYQRNVFDKINQNLRTIGGILIGLALLFTLIAIALINNTIRLHLYAQRFLVKSMQLVGATNWFIIKPFVFRSILNGLLGSIMAISLVLTVLNILPDYVDGIEKLYNTEQFLILFAFLFVLGQFISILSSLFITRKYLNMRIEDLY